MIISILLGILTAKILMDVIEYRHECQMKDFRNDLDAASNPDGSIAFGELKRVFEKHNTFAKRWLP